MSETTQIVLAIIAAVVTISTISSQIIGLVISYFQAVKLAEIKVSADRASVKVDKVKDDLMQQQAKQNDKADETLKVIHTVHSLVNSNMTAALKLTAELSRWKADERPDDKEFRGAAELAEKNYREHVAGQKAVDDKKKRRLTVREFPSLLSCVVALVFLSKGFFAPAPPKRTPPPTFSPGSFVMTWRGVDATTHFCTDHFYACHWQGRWWHGRWECKNGLLTVEEYPYDDLKSVTKWTIKLSSPTTGVLNGDSPWKLVVKKWKVH